MFFCYFVKKSSFLVKFDIKKGFSDSFSFQKCILLYTFQQQFESYSTQYVSKKFGFTPLLKPCQNLKINQDIRITFSNLKVRSSCTMWPSSKSQTQSKIQASWRARNFRFAFQFGKFDKPCFASNLVSTAWGSLNSKLSQSLCSANQGDTSAVQLVVVRLHYLSFRGPSSDNTLTHRGLHTFRGPIRGSSENIG